MSSQMNRFQLLKNIHIIEQGLSEEFIRDCLGIENIIKTNCRMNQMFKLLNPDKKMKVDGIDDHIIESLKIIENGGDVLPLNNDTLEE